MVVLGGGRFLMSEVSLNTLNPIEMPPRISYDFVILYRGTSLIRTSTPPQGRNRALGIFLL